MIDPPIINEKLQERTIQGNLRRLVDHSHLKDFSSNDYLGLARNMKIKELFEQELTHYDRLFSGGTGSRLLSGNLEIHQNVEEFLAAYFKGEGALLFNSGYVANQGLISAIAGKMDTILYDQLSHVCIKEGVWLSRSTSYSFRHNDLNDLEEKLKKAKGSVYVITESIFSMDGDISPLKEIIALCEKYNAYLIVDEAHSTGIYGEGSGYLVENELENKVFARVYTFGKAVGYHGACIVGSAKLRDYLVNFCRTFIYTTSLPPDSAIKIRVLLKYIRDHPEMKDNLIKMISLFRTTIRVNTNSYTAIQPVLIRGNDTCRYVASHLQENGFDVRPILSPTVRKGEERIRISLHAHNAPEDVQELAREINAVI